MQKAITAATQDHLPVEDVIDDVVVLKDGSAALVLQTTAVNFGLLSEKEQDAIIFAYGALLNSLSHPVQILIRSQRTDISSYLEQLETSYQKQTNPDLKAQIEKYIEFVKTTVQKGRVLDKKFYIIIPFSLLELGAAKAAAGFTKRKKGLTYPKEYIVEQARINLYPKKDQLLKQLSRVGLKGEILTQPELVELFFDIYNPQAVGTQKITAEAGTYTGPIVEPAIAAAPEEPTQSPKQPPTVTSGQENLVKQESLQTPRPSQAGIQSQKPKPEGILGQSPVPPPTQVEQQSSPQPTTPEVPKPGDSDRVLKELQDLIEKARSGLSPKEQGLEPGKQETGASSGKPTLTDSELLKQKIESKTENEEKGEN